MQGAFALHQQGRLEEARAGYLEVIRLQPRHFDALHLLGALAMQAGQYEEAVGLLNSAIGVDPRQAAAHANLAHAQRVLNRPQQAIESCDQALRLDPGNVAACVNRGLALRDMERNTDALAEFDRALALQPGAAATLEHRGHALRKLARFGEAAECFAQLLVVAPEHDYARGALLHMRLQGCDWTDYARLADDVLASVRAGRRADYPFSFLAIAPTVADQRRCGESFAAQIRPASMPLLSVQQDPEARIRVAYVSGDFREHATSYLMAGVFEQHDRARFEVIGVSFRPAATDPTGLRVSAAFDRFIDVSQMNDREVAMLLRDMNVDIAVDLMGFTNGSRSAVFAHRAAPVQVNYLGFPGTLGAGYMDYILADRFVIPEAQRGAYAEKVVWLPDCFQANDDRRAISAQAPSRREAGLPATGFVFCSFNNGYKINPEIFAVWMRLLAAVPGSVLWLVADGASARANLGREAVARGVDPARLVFAPRLDYPRHLARLGLADLFLDTLPFNAGTTASDALWAGVPVLTCTGEAFASRMSGSLLGAAGLPELVTHSLAEYEARAMDLARHPDRLAALRARLQRNRGSCALFDTRRFCRNLERAYAAMWERHCSGEPPGAIALPASAPARRSLWSVLRGRVFGSP